MPTFCGHSRPYPLLPGLATVNVSNRNIDNHFAELAAAARAFLSCVVTHAYNVAAVDSGIQVRLWAALGT
jgi:hypothetical protein